MNRRSSLKKILTLALSFIAPTSWACEGFSVSPENVMQDQVCIDGQVYHQFCMTHSGDRTELKVRVGLQQKLSLLEHSLISGRERLVEQEYRSDLSVHTHSYVSLVDYQTKQFVYLEVPYLCAYSKKQR